VGLFGYGLICDALDPALSTKQRGRLVRSLASQVHPGPFGGPGAGEPGESRIAGSAPTYRVGSPRWSRRRAGSPGRPPPEVLKPPGRTAAQVALVLGAHVG